MKLVKILLLITIFTVTSSLAVLNYHQDGQDNYTNPLDEAKNEYYQKLKFALSTNQINLSSPISVNTYTKKVSFTALSPQSRTANVTLSTQKDPYLQSASLQKIFTEATIKGKHVNLIDLSLKHSYVTLQDN